MGPHHNHAMKRTLFIAVVIVLIAYGGACAAMFAFQRSLLYFPQPRAVHAAASTMLLPVDGATLVVTARPRDGPKAIVYFGGNAEDVSQSLARFSADFPDHALYLLHYRGYGGSSGSPSEAANHADAAALFRVVHARHAEVAVIGRSLGSGIAVRLAGTAPAARLVLITPYDSIVELGATLYPLLPVRWLARDRYESGLVAPGIRVPTTIIAAERDEVIPRASTEQLLRRFAPGIATMTVIARAGHNDLDSRPAYRQALQAAL